MKALFYSLNAAIWQHAALENRLVRELVGRNCETIYVTCEKTFTEYCTSYSAANINLSTCEKVKKSVCNTCTKNALFLVKGSGARHLKLKDFISAEDEKKISAYMRNINRNNYLKFNHLGVNVGRLTCYECFLLYKKMSEKLSDEEWNYYLIYFRNALRSLIGFSKIFKLEKPKNVFFYSPQYVVNGVCAQYANIQGARTYFLEGSSNIAERYSAIRIWDWNKHGLVNPALKHWPDIRNRINEDDIRRVSGHLNELIKGESYAVYSDPLKGKINLRKHFKIPRKKRIVLATLSSFDEAYAAFVIGKFPIRKVKSQVYKNQFDWIKSTVAFFENRNDLFLIIRIHPRDYANKRESFQSEQAKVWETLLKSLPVNVRVNWPQDGISLYAMLDQVDVMLTGWSATGIEAMLFGVPVVTYDSFLPSFPSDIHLTAKSKVRYFRNIEKALNTSKKIKIAVKAYRWLAANFSLGTVRLQPLEKNNIKYSKNKLLPGFIKKWLYQHAEQKAKRKDASCGFFSEAEADRFINLCLKGEENLFGSVRQIRSLIKTSITDRVIKKNLAEFHSIRKKALYTSPTNKA